MSILKTCAKLVFGFALCITSHLAPAYADDILDLSPQQTGYGHVNANPTAIAAIPADFKFVTPGTLTVASAVGGPPLATFATDAKTVIGSEPDFARAIADSLGLKLNFIAIAWADWPLGLVSGKYDAVISNVGVTEERKEKYDFSSYRRGGHGFFVPLNSPVQSIKEPKDAAGLRIIVGAGTNQERILLRWNDLNVKAGLKPIELQYYDDEATQFLALKSGRADAILQPYSTLAFIAKRDKTIRPVGYVSAGWPERSDVAIVTRKGSGLANALTIATNGLIADGTYGTILKHWGLEDEFLKQSETNPPGMPKY